MRLGKKYSAEEIIGKLREAEVLVSQGSHALVEKVDGQHRKRWGWLE